MSYIHFQLQPAIHGVLLAGSEGKQTLSALPALAERHLLHPSCFCHLHFSLTTHAALTLEGISCP